MQRFKSELCTRVTNHAQYSEPRMLKEIFPVWCWNQTNCFLKFNSISCLCLWKSLFLRLAPFVRKCPSRKFGLSYLLLIACLLRTKIFNSDHRFNVRSFEIRGTYCACCLNFLKFVIDTTGAECLTFPAKYVQQKETIGTTIYTGQFETD